jgi:hypothetical protein
MTERTRGLLLVSGILLFVVAPLGGSLWLGTHPYGIFGPTCSPSRVADVDASGTRLLYVNPDPFPSQVHEVVLVNRADAEKVRAHFHVGLLAYVCPAAGADRLSIEDMHDRVPVNVRHVAVHDAPYWFPRKPAR